MHPYQKRIADAREAAAKALWPSTETPENWIKRRCQSDITFARHLAESLLQQLRQRALAGGVRYWSKPTLAVIP